MKKNQFVTLAAAFLFSSSLVNAQLHCTTPVRENTALQYSTHKSSHDPTIEYHIPVNVISFQDIGGGYESLASIQQGLDLMVADFLPMNIFLHPTCINEVRDPDIPLRPIESSWMDNHINSNYYYPDAITIFVFGPNHSFNVGFNGGNAPSSGQGRYFYVGGNYPYEASIRAVETHLLSHEMGHIFGLEHTFHSATSMTTIPGSGPCRELVDGSNCEDCGDYICGTPASYALDYNNLSDCSMPTVVTELYTGSPYTPITTNLMDYTTSSCMGSFVMGNGDQHVSQESRMKYFLVNDQWLSGLEVFSLPSTVSVCDGNFQAICGPISDNAYTYLYEWYVSDPVTQTSILVAANQGIGNECYTPTEYGAYSLVVTDQSDCRTTYQVNVVEGSGPEVTIADYTYCQKKGSPFTGFPPANVGCAGPYDDALSYSWTYDNLLGGGPVELQYNQHQIPNQGDGEYCLTIYWSDANVPSLLGCTSVTCFTVEECCQPNVTFTMDWEPMGSSSTITIQNNVNYTFAYDFEEFVLFEDCNGTGWVPSGQSIARSSNFNDPVVFSGLDESCNYKVAHRVSSTCLQKSYEIEMVISWDLKMAAYPNPAVNNGEITIKMLYDSEDASVVIYEIITGRIVFEGTVNSEETLTVPENYLSKGQYYMKATNNRNVVTELLIVQ